MSVITYGAHARAPLMAGHTAGNSYSFEINFMRHEKNYESPKAQHRALDGTTETVLERVSNLISIEIGTYDLTLEPQIEEFIKSVAGGEAFSIDLFGTIATPDAPLNVKLTDKSNSPMRHGPRTFSLPFNVLVV